MKWLAIGLALIFIVVSAFLLSIDSWLWTSIIAIAAAALAPPIIARRLARRRPANPRDLYGTSEMAGVSAMAEGGITTEKRR